MMPYDAAKKLVRAFKVRTKKDYNALRAEENLVDCLPEEPSTYLEYKEWKDFTGSVCTIEFEKEYELFIRKILKKKGIDSFVKKKKGRPYEI